MTEEQKNHYHKMYEKNRAIPFMLGNIVVGFCTFYITDNIDKYVKSNPWNVLEDNCNGKICYINQLLTNKETTKDFYKGWKSFKKYIKDNFPNVSTITWRRWYRHSNSIKQFNKRLSYGSKICSSIIN